MAVETNDLEGVDALRERDLRATASDVLLLGDGTRLSDLVDVEKREVSLRVLSDPQIFELEMERIFARAWVAVAHVSEIPNAGDYLVRRVGLDPVVVTRGTDGSVEVFLNVCSHRGMQVCRAEVGNARTFRCPYHGWIYGLDGALKAVPAEREMYGEGLDKKNLGLPKARVGECGGMIYATWDEEAPSLEEYLGDYKYYIDTIFSRTDSGMEVVGPPQRWIVDANWKLAAEQFSGDSYHAMTLHRSIQELGFFDGFQDKSDPRSLGIFGTGVFTNGHGLRSLDQKVLWKLAAGGTDSLTMEQKLAMVPPAGMTPELTQQLSNHLTDGQIDILVNSPPTTGNIFPNLTFLNFIFPTFDGIGAVITWRVWAPIGPGQMEVMSWVLVEKDATEDVKERTRKTSVLMLNDSGLFEQDDTLAWLGIQQSVAGVRAKRRTLNYQSKTGAMKKPEGWEGGGVVQEDFSRDDNQWNFWLRWHEFMTGKPW